MKINLLNTKKINETVDFIDDIQHLNTRDLNSGVVYTPVSHPSLFPRRT